MRGDSVRDFYAKAVALLGLGVLAGAGALVDYWPTPSALPDPGQAFAMPIVAAALPVPAVAAMAEARPSPFRPDRRLLRRIDRTGVFDFVTQSASLAVSESVIDPPRVIAEPARQMAVASDVLLASLVGESVRLQPVNALEIVAADRAPASVVPATDTSDGLIAGAFKKTGDSIARAGAKTGSSILGAFRAVGSAVHKALPL